MDGEIPDGLGFFLINHSKARTVRSRLGYICSGRAGNGAARTNILELPVSVCLLPVNR